MEENIETLKEFQKLQLKYFEEILSLSDIDEVDATIEDAFEEFELSTVINEIKIKEKENFRQLDS